MKWNASQMLKRKVFKCQNFELNSEFNGEPVQWAQQRCDMRKFRNLAAAFTTISVENKNKPDL